MATAAERAGEEPVLPLTKAEREAIFAGDRPDESDDDMYRYEATVVALESQLLAARRENETAVLHLRTLAAHARGEPTDAIALNKAMRAALAATETR